MHTLSKKDLHLNPSRTPQLHYMTGHF